MDEFFPLQFEAVTELQGVENSADDSEELQAQVAKHVSINNEDEQLREALFGTQLNFIRFTCKFIARAVVRKRVIICVCAHCIFLNGVKCMGSNRIRSVLCCMYF